MSNNRVDILTPFAVRLVQGSLYNPKTTDLDGNPLVTKTGPNAGQPRADYFFAVAIPKGAEQHWNQTEWGAKIWNIGVTAFPNGQYMAHTFAWKVIDGDSPVPNKKGIRPCDREGFPGHWVLNFNSSIAPQIVNKDGSKQIIEKDYINLGDYVQVFGNISDNNSQQSPGIYLNHKFVAFNAYGEPISTGVDPKAVGFGNGVLPTGASLTPIGQGINPVSVAAPIVPLPTYTPPPPPPVVAAPVVPYPQILVPPVPIVPPAPITPIHVMTPKAQGATYDAFIKAGYDDITLIQQGYMLA